MIWRFFCLALISYLAFILYGMFPESLKFHNEESNYRNLLDDDSIMTSITPFDNELDYGSNSFSNYAGSDLDDDIDCFIDEIHCDFNGFSGFEEPF